VVAEATLHGVTVWEDVSRSAVAGEFVALALAAGKLL